MSETTGLLLKSAILCWKFLNGTFTIHQWRSHVIFNSIFLARVYQFPLGKKEHQPCCRVVKSRLTGGVAGLKQRQPHSVDSFHECFDELHNSVELIETVSRVRTRHKREEET